MAHRTITISESAYRRLARLKREGESFTEVILDVVPDPASTLGELLRRNAAPEPQTKPKPRRERASA